MFLCPHAGATQDTVGEVTHILLAGRVAGVARALPALGDAAGGRVARDVVGAAAGRADGVGVAAQDNVAAHAVRRVGLGAVDLGAGGHGVLRLRGGQGGGEDHGGGGGGSLHDGGVVRSVERFVKKVGPCLGVLYSSEA